MRLPLGWLAEYVDHGLGPDDLAERLADSGTAVEDVEALRVPAAGGNLDHFRVGRVLEAEQHPNADRLRVCRVDVGEESPRRIVCGAPNARAGLTVAVALPGAVLPGREPLGTVTLRGVESSGMLCSETELGLPGDGGGIVELDTDAPPGTRLSDVLPIVETVLDLEITSNRPDCLGVYGVAREVHAVTGAPLAPLDDSDPPADGDGEVGDLVTLTVEAPDLCPRYMARAFTGVTVGPSPAWMQARLAAAGMRPISNVVDVTNYVMLLTGQPLHAFDLDRMAGPAVVVRRAGDGEPVTTLDGQRRALSPDMLAICDAERPCVIAGIMGAEDVEVNDGTTRLLLEAAAFDGPTILRTSLALGLRSESSGRFEKGLPVELPERALRIASRLLVELCGARMVPGTLDTLAAPPPAPATIRVRTARTNAVLGIDIPVAEARETLTRLGFGVADAPGGLDVTVPFERRDDVTREADLIEEVGRIHGYADVPVLLPRLVGDGRRTPAQALARRLTRRAADLGLHEAVTYRFVPEADADLMRMAADDPRRDVLTLANPISEEMAVMRRSMLPGLLRAAARNQRHQRMTGGLFEVGRTYAPAGDLADEREFLAALMFGPPVREHWRGDPGDNDVFHALGVANALCRVAGVRPDAAPNAAPYFHPVRQARLAAGDVTVGWVGEVHPRVLANFDVTGPATAVVLDLAGLRAAAPSGAAQYEDLLSVPVSTRDLAVVVGRATPAAALVATARTAGAPLVRDAAVFDRYEGAQVGEGRVSLALRLTIADPGRTLTDDEIAAAAAAVRDALAAEHGAEPR
ncbi:MAG: phenylalanine--tRNA ligase subunit beta [Thermoleophilia bacterium]|nr:phenylalanine--tRNA ligase subunit beta [Thermoleophilia bacterium]